MLFFKDFLYLFVKLIVSSKSPTKIDFFGGWWQYRYSGIKKSWYFFFGFRKAHIFSIIYPRLLNFYKTLGSCHCLTPEKRSRTTTAAVTREFHMWIHKIMSLTGDNHLKNIGWISVVLQRGFVKARKFLVVFFSSSPYFTALCLCQLRSATVFSNEEGKRIITLLLLIRPPSTRVRLTSWNRGGGGEAGSWYANLLPALRLCYSTYSPVSSKGSSTSCVCLRANH